MEELKKSVSELEIARSRLTQEGGDLGKQVEEYESKITVFLKSKKTLEQSVEELKRQNEEEVRVSAVKLTPFFFFNVWTESVWLNANELFD